MIGRAFGSLFALLAFACLAVGGQTTNGVGECSSSGFVFIDGRYVELPYFVTASNGSVYINGSIARRFATEWPPKVESPEKPKIPKDILSRAKSFDDLVITNANGETVDAWHCRMIRWIGQNAKDDDNVVENARSFIANLPFVKEAKIDRLKGEFVITLKSGTVTRYGTMMQRKASPVQWVERAIEDYASFMRNTLANGRTYLCFSNGMTLSFGEPESAENLALMCEILASTQTSASKLNILRRMGILPDGYDNSTVMGLVNGFRMSDELTNRVYRLKDKTGIQPRTIDSIPDFSPAETERRAIDAAIQKKAIHQ